jgi:hypothetical protein
MRGGKVVDKYCSGSSQVQNAPESPDVYASRFSKMGNRAASSAGISAESRGSTTKATANPRRAVIRFANDDAQAEARQLRALILRKGKKPAKRWYPQQSTETQQ